MINKQTLQSHMRSIFNDVTLLIDSIESTKQNEYKVYTSEGEEYSYNPKEGTFYKIEGSRLLAPDPINKENFESFSFLPNRTIFENNRGDEFIVPLLEETTPQMHFELAIENLINSKQEDKWMVKTIEKQPTKGPYELYKVNCLAAKSDAEKSFNVRFKFEIIPEEIQTIPINKIKHLSKKK